MTYGLWSLGLSYAIESHPLMDAILFPYVSKDQNSLSNHLLRFRNLVTNNVCTLCKVCTSRQLMFDQHHSNMQSRLKASIISSFPTGLAVGQLRDFLTFRALQSTFLQN